VTQVLVAEAEPLEVPALAAGYRRRRGRFLYGPNALALYAYGLISLLADLPVYPGDPSRVSSQLGEDIIQTAWFLEYTPYALLHGKNLFSTTLLNYPTGVDLAQNTGMPLLGLLTAPLTLAVNPIASMNLLRFLAFTLSGFAAYYVLRRLTRWAPAAFVGGLLYGFSPYMVSQGALHLNLVFVPLPPLLLYGLYELLVLQRAPAWRTGLLLGLGAAAQFYISAEVLATTALVAGIAVFYLFFLCIRDVPRHAAHAAVGLGIAAAVLGALIAYPTWLMFHGPQHYVGPAQGFNNVYNADLLGPVLPTTAQLVAPSHLRAVGASLVGNNPQENGSYLGIPLLIVAFYLTARYWRRLWPLYLALLALTTFVLSLGPLLVVDGHVHLLPVDLPFRKIDHLPGIDNILPVRLSLYVVFFVAVIIALGIDALRDDITENRVRRVIAGVTRLPRRAVAARAAGAAVALACIVALIPDWPYPSFAAHVNRAEQPKLLSLIPAGAVVLAYPYPTSFDDDAMLWQALDSMRFRLLGGYALVRAPDGTSSVFPSVLEPSAIEAMLVNSVTPIPDPHLADLVATSTSVTATEVVVLRDGARLPAGRTPALVGHVDSVNAKAKTLYVAKKRFSPENVVVGAATAYVETWARHPSLNGVAPGETVAVYGKTGTGTVNPTTVLELRHFLFKNHVQSVIVGLGITDGWEVGNWFKAALGPPTRAGGGGEIWVNVPAALRSTA